MNRCAEDLIREHGIPLPSLVLHGISGVWNSMIHCKFENNKWVYGHPDYNTRTHMVIIGTGNGGSMQPTFSMDELIDLFDKGDFPGFCRLFEIALIQYQIAGDVG